jgi:hypothetical protein
MMRLFLRDNMIQEEGFMHYIAEKHFSISIAPVQSRVGC